MQRGNRRPSLRSSAATRLVSGAVDVVVQQLAGKRLWLTSASLFWCVLLVQVEFVLSRTGPACLKHVLARGSNPFLSSAPCYLRACVLRLHHLPVVNSDIDQIRQTCHPITWSTPLLSYPGPTPPPSTSTICTFQLSTRVILGMVEEIKAGKEPSPLPTKLVDSFRATLTQKVQALNKKHEWRRE